MGTELESLEYSPGTRRNRKRVGRGPGSGTGKTSGRGHKGQKARAGYSRRRGFEGGQMPLSRRVPKRGFTSVTRYPFAQVNLEILDKHFENGAEVNEETLLAAKLIQAKRGGIKILGRGEISKPIKVKANAISDAARVKIEKAGGTVEVIVVPEARAKKNRKKTKQAKA